MTARQPRTPQEAAMLDPTGLMAFPPNQPRGLFGSGRRRRSAMFGNGAQAGDQGATGYRGVQPTMPPPPITDAPPPPADWASQLGPEMLGNLPQQPLSTQGLPPAPPMRGGPLGNRGMFGNSAIPLGAPGAPPSPAALAAGAGSALQRGGNTMADTAAGAMPKKKGVDWRMIAGIVGDGLLGAAGQPGVYGPAMYRERQARADQQRQLSEITLRSRLDAAKPDYFTVNNDRVRYDPTTGATETLYTAPEDFDRYARSLGAEPGTPEYDRLAQDYVLRTGGPTATGLNMEEEDHRQGNRLGLEGVRQNNRSALVSQRLNNSLTLRQSPTYGQRNPKQTKPTGRGAGGGVREGQTATGPGGAKMVYRGGKWVPTK